MANVDEIKQQARGVVMDQIDRRTTDVGNMVGGHVNNLREMGDSLRGQGQDGTARLVDQAADRLNAISTYLTSTDGERIVHDVETIARNQPLITGAIGVLAGMTAARLLKAAASQRYRTYASAEYSRGTYAESVYTGAYDAADTESEYGIR